MYADLIDLLGSERSVVHSLKEGMYLFHRGDPVRRLYLVEQGAIHLVRHQADGRGLVLQQASAGDIVAEASIFSDEYHCDGIALTDVTIRTIEKTHFLEYFSSNPQFALSWAKRLAAKVQEARLRGEILSLKTVRERLDAWLDWYGTLPPKGEWRELASAIAVSPEALYREISRRRGNGPAGS
ncbi:Crp/Fnr family transcriptional regulator [Hartmannibacter diazotrophicus]|nr:Crp/Fnr family transcriptional regulator [Hartmannibacter diazotrophicus]